MKKQLAPKKLNMYDYLNWDFSFSIDIPIIGFFLDIILGFLMIIIIPIQIILYPFFYLLNKNRLNKYYNETITVKFKDVNNQIFKSVIIKRKDFVNNVKNTLPSKSNDFFKEWLFEDNTYITDKYYLFNPTVVISVYKQNNVSNLSTNKTNLKDSCSLNKSIINSEKEIIETIYHKKNDLEKSTNNNEIKILVDNQDRKIVKTISRKKIDKIKLSGVTFNNRQTNISELIVNQELFLIRERDNIYDKHAILVVDKNDNDIGYIPKVINKKYSKLYDQGIVFESYLYSVSGGGNYNFGVTIAVTYEEENTYEKNKSLDIKVIDNNQPIDNIINYSLEKNFYNSILFDEDGFIEEDDYNEKYQDLYVPIDIEFD